MVPRYQGFPSAWYQSSSGPSSRECGICLRVWVLELGGTFEAAGPDRHQGAQPLSRPEAGPW